MKRFFVLALISAVSFSATETSSVSKESFEHEILLSATQVGIRHSENRTTIGVGFGYNYTLNEYIQLGLFPTVAYSFGDGWGGITSASMAVGPTFNYSVDHRLQSAFFLSPKAGINHFNSANINVSWASAHLELGKRFEITEFLVYRPSVELRRDFHDAFPTNSVQFNVLSFAATF